MNQDREFFQPPPPPSRVQARAFKAIFVMTRHDGTEPSIEDVRAFLKASGVAFAMPGQQDGPIVISINDK